VRMANTQVASVAWPIFTGDTAVDELETRLSCATPMILREGSSVRGNAETHADIGPRSNIGIPTRDLVYLPREHA
jgi:hypothetical protein